MGWIKRGKMVPPRRATTRDALSTLKPNLGGEHLPLWLGNLVSGRTGAAGAINSSSFAPAMRLVIGTRAADSATAAQKIPRLAGIQQWHWQTPNRCWV
jgi:hypothetical protein